MARAEVHVLCPRVCKGKPYTVCPTAYAGKWTYCFNMGCHRLRKVKQFLDLQI